ncbi:hypothetical protein [Ruminococcus flavefaciens]|nr:hypothetical protein [Ruminococcus flavefaciens]
MFGVTKDFIDAAMPWVAYSVAIAYFAVCSDSEKKKEKEHEK